MKIAFIGNCQLEVLGNVLASNKDKFQHLFPMELVWNTPLYKLTDNNIAELFFALDGADVIYHQFYSSEWGKFSTENLKKYFNIKLVPTLESHISSPQLGYWNASNIKIPPSYVYVDFRLLDLYLRGLSFEQAASVYTKFDFDENNVRQKIIGQSEKYHQLFLNNDVIFDYSNFFRESLLANSEEYFTISHPNNKHLSFLINSILNDIGVDFKLNINGPELLLNSLAPKRNSTDDSYLMQRSITTKLAAKLYFDYFSNIDHSILLNELNGSNYFNLLR
jgi:hypothetical protein